MQAKALSTYTLGEVMLAHKAGRITDAEAEAYLALWNDSAFRFHHAYLDGAGIHQHDADEPVVRCAACKAGA